MRSTVNGKEQRHKDPPNTALSIVKAIKTNIFRKRFLMLRGERKASITLKGKDNKAVPNIIPGKLSGIKVIRAPPNKKKPMITYTSAFCKREQLQVVELFSISE
jgi:hypothetical protein